MRNKIINHLNQGTLLQTARTYIISKAKVVFIQPFRNYTNQIKYGSSAPRYGETIYVDPKHCQKGLPDYALKEFYGLNEWPSTGKVVKKWPIDYEYNLFPEDNGNMFRICDWDYQPPLEFSIRFRIKACIDHFEKGIPWEETGIYELMETEIFFSKFGERDNCKTKEDIMLRYENLDKIYNQIKKEGALREKDKISLSGFPKKMINQTCTIHIGPQGKPFFEGGWVHRFAIAYILKIPFTATIGLVHVSAIPYLNNFRKLKLG